MDEALFTNALAMTREQPAFTVTPVLIFAP
jgi:hypothetical protein